MVENLTFFGIPLLLFFSWRQFSHFYREERASSQLMVSSATPSLGPGGPGGSWAGRACSHHLGGALGSGGCGLDDYNGPLGVGAEWSQNHSEGPSAEG